MVVLVTGATGLIGKSLVAALLHKGHKVHYLTTSPKKIQNTPSYKGFLWNPAEYYLDENALENVQVIFHLAGATIAKRWTRSYKAEILSSRLTPAQTLHDYLRKVPNQVKQVIAASGTAIYPNNTGKYYLEIETNTASTFLGNVVKQWEANTNQLKSLGIQVCLLRTGVVFAATGGALPQLVFPIKMGFGSLMGNGNQLQSWIHLQDIVGLYVFAMEHSWEGTYNAVAPEVISNRTQTQLIAKILKRPLFLPATPKWLMQFILGEMHQLVFTDTQISCQKALDAGYVFQFPTAKKALRACLK
jgi:uncharacterized protein (TIGR01777 family)